MPMINHGKQSTFYNCIYMAHLKQKSSRYKLAFRQIMQSKCALTQKCA